MLDVSVVGVGSPAIAIYRLNVLGQIEVVSALAIFTIVLILALSVVATRLSGSSEGPTRPETG